jgi:hypothetical protein
MDEVLEWVEKNPVPSALIGGVVVLGLLWLFGFFTPKAAPASNNTGAANMAAAYYAAEQAQTVAGTQVQLATENDAAATAQTQLQTQAATAIAATNANAANYQAEVAGLVQQNINYQNANVAIQNAQIAATSGDLNAYYNLTASNAQSQAAAFLGYANSPLAQELINAGYPGLTQTQASQAYTL